MNLGEWHSRAMSQLHIAVQGEHKQTPRQQCSGSLGLLHLSSQTAIALGLPSNTLGLPYPPQISLPWRQSLHGVRQWR